MPRMIQRILEGMHQAASMEKRAKSLRVELFAAFCCQYQHQMDECYDKLHHPTSLGATGHLSDRHRNLSPRSATGDW